MAELNRIADGLVFPECPRWHGGKLWFSDCHDGKVIALDPGGEVVETFAVPGGPAGLGWLPDGDLLVVSIGDLCVYRRASDGELTLHCDLSDYHRHHTNDMVVDTKGNAYVGEVGFRIPEEQKRSTAIVLVRPDGSSEVAFEPVLTPNGSVITDDGKTFIVAESQERRLTRFRIAEDGTLADGETFAQLAQDHVPDGICLDAEGCVWVACPSTASVVRVHPKDGVVERIGTQDSRPYACVLGGKDRRDLYVCCATSHDPETARKVRLGSIRAVRVNVPGAGLP